MFFLVFQWENGWRKWRFFHRGFSEEERGFWVNFGWFSWGFGAIFTRKRGKMKKVIGAVFGGLKWWGLGVL